MTLTKTTIPWRLHKTHPTDVTERVTKLTDNFNDKLNKTLKLKYNSI